MAGFIRIGAARVFVASPAADPVRKNFSYLYTKPKYLKDAQGYRAKGSDVVVMEVDEQSGYVKSAKMEKSTGHKLLDGAALQAFNRWQFNPGGAFRESIAPSHFGTTE